MNQVLGDGIMALFGAPIAETYALPGRHRRPGHADGTAALQRRAAHAGLTLQTRVGLNSGEVVVRTISNDLHMDYYCRRTNGGWRRVWNSSRLPGTILLTAATLRLAEGLGAGAAPGAHAGQGTDRARGGLRTARRQCPAPPRMSERRTGLTRFVGRQHELDTLAQALEQARTGHGQVVALVGLERW